MNFFFDGGGGGGGVSKVHYALCKNGELFLLLGEKVHCRKVWISLRVPKVTNINFRLTISMYYASVNSTCAQRGHSGGGERCEAKKAMKSRGGLGREHSDSGERCKK